MKNKRTTPSVLAMAVVWGAAALSAQAAPPMVLILDGSGSMWGRIGGEEKITVARRVVGELVDELPTNAPVGLVAYGHRRDGDCRDIETLLPIGPLDKAAVKRQLSSLTPKGKTPISASIEAALGLLGKNPGTVVLITDGLETCGGDPCATVRAARERGLDLVLHVVGFDVAKEDVTQLECAAQAGRGLYLPAANALELSAALATATALPAGTTAGVLAVRAFSQEGLEDALVEVRRPGQRQPVTASRTYRSASTNPRRLPLPAGEYEVTVRVLGIKGAPEHSFAVTIEDGATVTKELDFSTGELQIGVTRNGELSDASYEVRSPNQKNSVASGRTYRGGQSNPAKVRLTAGTYEVKIKALEVSGGPTVSLGTVEVKPGGKASVAHDLLSGDLLIGVRRGDELVDAVVAVTNADGPVNQGRTYKAATSNPKRFVVAPGRYRIEIDEIRGEKRTFEVSVAARETVSRTVDLDAPP